MVHALLQMHRILRPGGLLINVNDLPTPHMIEVHSQETIHRLGWLLDKEEFKSELSAFNALANVVEEGHFTLEDERDFGFNIYVDGLNELQEWLAEWWSSAILSDNILERLKELMRESGQPTRIVLNLQIRMTKLRVA